jgi:hypothetical protein
MLLGNYSINTVVLLSIVVFIGRQPNKSNLIQDLRRTRIIQYLVLQCYCIISQLPLFLRSYRVQYSIIDNREVPCY